VARTSLHDRLQAGNTPAPKGREALHQAPVPVSTEADQAPGQPLTVDGKPSSQVAERWEDSHTRVTFYCPVSLVKTVESEVADSGKSKSQVIVDALQGHLRGRRTRRG